MNDGRGYQEINTAYIRDEIGNCESVEDLRKEIFPLLQDQSASWARKVAGIMEDNRYNQSSFAKACGVSRPTVIKWCKGVIPKNRETFLRIGLAAHYGREEMDQLLVRNGRYPALYAKTLEDCVCIYVLQRDYEDPVAQYQAILERIKDNIIARDADADAAEMETVVVDQRLADVKDTDELEHFVQDYSSIFAQAYNKLYSYIEQVFEDSDYGYAGNAYELAEHQQWSSSLRQCVSAINNNKWYPTRNKIISLGLHLSMDHRELDHVLELAYMEPLCAKNLFESAIIFILEDASLNNLLDQGDENYDQDALLLYARDVLQEIDMKEMAAFLTELPEDDRENE